MTGTMGAPTPEALADHLKQMGYLVTRAEEVSDVGTQLTSALRWTGRVGADQLVLLNIQLSKMIQVGIPLMTALNTLESQTAHRVLRQALGLVARDVEAGLSFSEALARQPHVFSPLFVSMIKAGEASGKLDEILGRLATFSQRQAELREQLRTALTYPCLLLLVGVAIIGFLVVGIIPKFMAIFLEAHVPLPLPTRVLYAISQMVRQHGLIMLAALIGVGTVVRSGLRTSAGRRWWDATVLRLPVVGPLATHAALCRFSRTFESLASSGVPILDALIMLQETSGNIIYQEAIKTVEDSVRQGGSIAEPLKTSGAFPPMAIQMLSIGEASGTLDHMLGQLAEHYDLLLRHGLKRAMAFVEPLFLGIMGSMVAFIMASVLLPMFRLVNVVH